MTVQLGLYSEQYSPTGNLAADGFRRLLGRPTLDTLQTVIREAVQNCCDAADNANGAIVMFHLRRLNDAQTATIAKSVFAELPNNLESSREISAFLNGQSRWVLDISDFGTCGLRGPTRADLVVDAEGADFVNFLRNVGSPRDTAQGGGTYGYGKASLYLSSRCSTILVDTQTTYRKQPVRRMMGCHLGSAYRAGRQSNARRYTGRHWWGTKVDNGFVDPLEGSACADLAEALGLTQRDAGLTGTTIMIVDPIFVEEDPTTVMRRIQEGLLWWFWPRMLETTPPERKVQFFTAVDNLQLPMPKPELTPPLNLFADAMNEIRGKGGVTTVRSERPRKDLGRLSMKKGIYSPRQWLVPPAQSLFPERSGAIALMRPVELVVKYLDGDLLPDPNVEWAGVFLTSDDRAVEAAFAAAEPPSHDDWQPNVMPKGNEKTFVNVALQRLKEASRSFAGKGHAVMPGAVSTVSLGHASRIFGNIMRGSVEETRSPRGRTSRKKASVAYASRPRFNRLELRGSQPTAVFTATLKPGRKSGAPQRVVAEAGIIADGSPIPLSEIDGPIPVVLDWKSYSGAPLGSGPQIPMPGEETAVEISVGITGEFAVSLRLSVEGAEAA